MVLNPKSAFYKPLKDVLAEDYEDLIWSEDAIFLERNSRTFKERSKTVNENTEALCDLLINHEKGNNTLCIHKLILNHLSTQDILS